MFKYRTLLTATAFFSSTTSASFRMAPNMHDEKSPILYSIIWYHPMGSNQRQSWNYSNISSANRGAWGETRECLPPLSPAGFYPVSVGLLSRMRSSIKEVEDSLNSREGRSKLWREWSLGHRLSQWGLHSAPWPLFHDIWPSRLDSDCHSWIATPVAPLLS